MDMNKEREVFEEKFNHLDLSFVEGLGYCESETQTAWEAWQAAKASAVPDGFILVKSVHPDAIVHNQGLSLFRECQVIYGWDGKSKDFKDALNKGFYHGVKLGAKAVLDATMIEAAQELSYATSNKN